MIFKVISFFLILLNFCFASAQTLPMSPETAATSLSACEVRKRDCYFNAESKRNSCTTYVNGVLGSTVGSIYDETCMEEFNEINRSCGMIQCTRSAEPVVDKSDTMGLLNQQVSIDQSTSLALEVDCKQEANLYHPTCLPKGKDAQLTSDGTAPKSVKKSTDTAADKSTTGTKTDTVSDTSGTAPQSTSTSSSSAQYDLQQAQQAQQGASQCCNNPASCATAMGSAGQGGLSQLASMGMMGGQGGQGGQSGLQAACQQMQGLGGAGSNTNSGFASVCYAKKSSCEGLTQQLISKHQSLGDPNGIVGQLQGIFSSCQALSQQLQAMSSQSSNASSAGGMGGLCDQLASSGMGNQINNTQVASVDPCTQDASSTACAICKQNPNAPGCVQSQQDSNIAGFSQRKVDDSGSFNTPDLTGMPTGEMTQPAGQDYQHQAATLVANNTGGAIPNNQQAAQAGGPNRQGGAGGGYNSDVLHNPQQTGQGGWSGYNAGINTDVNGSAAGWGNRLPASESNPYSGLDLKKYLPGNEKDPRRMMAGLGSATPDIGPKYGDIFKRISDRVKTLCRFNRLMGCEEK